MLSIELAHPSTTVGRHVLSLPTMRTQNAKLYSIYLQDFHMILSFRSEICHGVGFTGLCGFATSLVPRSNAAGVSVEESFLLLHCTGGVPKRYKQGERGAVNSFMELTWSSVPLSNAASMDAKSGIRSGSRDESIKCVECRLPFVLSTCGVLHDITPTPPKTSRSAFRW